MTPIVDYRREDDIQPLTLRRRLILLTLILSASILQFSWVVFYYSGNFWSHLAVFDSPILLFFAPIASLCAAIPLLFHKFHILRRGLGAVASAAALGFVIAIAVEYFAFLLAVNIWGS